MTTLEKIRQLSDNEVLALYQNFSVHLISKTKVNAMDVIKDPPEKLNTDKNIQSIKQADVDALETALKPEEVIPVVRLLTEQWAQNEEIAPVLEEFMKNHQIHTMAAGTILAIGSVLVMTIVSGSLKVNYKDGKLQINYDSNNISDNAVEMVKAILTKIPDSLKNMFSKS